MQFVYLVKAHPSYGESSYLLSHHPSDSRDMTEKSATHWARREHVLADHEDVQDKIQILALDIPVPEYETWRSYRGFTCSHKEVDEFHEMNRRARLVKLAKDEMRITTKAIVVAQGMTSPDSIFNKLSPDLGGAISAFSTEANILKGPVLEHIAVSQIEKHITKKTPLPQTDRSA